MTFDALDMEITAITVGVLIMYFFICELFSQTIGKKILGLKIKYKGKGIIAKILRPIVKVLTLYLIPFVVIFSAFLPGNKLYYDFIFGTEVIDENSSDYNGGSLR